MYVLVRSDLKSDSYKAVQAGHALAEFLINHNSNWNNGYLIYLCVRDEFELEKVEFKLKSRDIPFSTFKEPDINFEKTAIAAYCRDEVFKNFKLL